MQESLDLGEFKTKWLEKIDTFKQKLAKIDDDPFVAGLAEPEIRYYCATSLVSTHSILIIINYYLILRV